MSEITTVGLDLAKNVFQAHGADARGRAVLRKKHLVRQQTAILLLPIEARRLADPRLAAAGQISATGVPRSPCFWMSVTCPPEVPSL